MQDRTEPHGVHPDNSLHLIPASPTQGSAFLCLPWVLIWLCRLVTSSRSRLYLANSEGIRVNRSDIACRSGSRGFYSVLGSNTFEGWEGFADASPCRGELLRSGVAAVGIPLCWDPIGGCSIPPVRGCFPRALRGEWFICNGAFFFFLMQSIQVTSYENLELASSFQ